MSYANHHGIELSAIYNLVVIGRVWLSHRGLFELYKYTGTETNLCYGESVLFHIREPLMLKFVGAHGTFHNIPSGHLFLASVTCNHTIPVTFSGAFYQR